jgi:predicted ferric reductase
MAIMGMQFLITARFRHVSEPYGMDIMYHFTGNLLVALVLVLAHPIIIFGNVRAVAPVERVRGWRAASPSPRPLCSWC